jgi:quercetin dioxygenase-like cupin family protein
MIRHRTTGQEVAAMPIVRGFEALQRLPEEKVTEQISRRVLAGERAMVVWWSMKAGVHAAAHHHPHEQVFWVLSGCMDFRLGGERRTCRAGDVGVIPGGVEHEAWFPEDTEVVDVFSPPREDFLTGEIPAYMRKAQG